MKKIPLNHHRAYRNYVFRVMTSLTCLLFASLQATLAQDGNAGAPR